MTATMPEVDIVALLDTLDPWTITIIATTGETREQECFPTYSTRGLERMLTASFEIYPGEAEMKVGRAVLTSPHGDRWEQELDPIFWMHPGDRLEFYWTLG